MTAKRFILTLGLLSFFPLGGWSGEDDAAAKRLAEQANARRGEAEKELAAFRAGLLSERKELAANLQAAYAELNAAHGKAEAAKTELAEVTKNRNEFRRDEASYRYKCRILKEQLDAAGVCPVGEDGNAAALAEKVWRNIQSRLVQLDAAREITLTEAPVVTRSGISEKLPVLHVGGVAAYACGETPDTVGILETMRNGNLRIAGLLPDGEGLQALRGASTGKMTVLPVDVTGALSTRELQRGQNWRDWLAAGGIFVYPILLCGVLGLLLIAERLHYLNQAYLPGKELDSLRNLLGNLTRGNVGDIAANTPEERLARVGLRSRHENDTERESRMEAALLAEAPRLNRSLSLLAALAGVAPLLGLLGTVSGMIHTFGDIASFGTGNSRILSGGISEALITTQLGLMMAVPLLLGHAWLSRSVERREVLLEQWGMDVLHILAQRKEDA